METIKQVGLKKIIDQPEFSAPSFQIHSILTSDLTEQEITDSLRVIGEMYAPLAEFINKYEELSEKLKKCEQECEIKKEEIKNTGGVNGLVFLLILPFAIAMQVLYKNIGSSWLIAVVSILFIFCLIMSYSILEEVSSKQVNELNAEIQKNMEPQIKTLKQQINNFSATKLLKNASFGVSALSAVIISKHLINLETILQKMLVIASDKKITASNRLLTMENYLYLLKKQDMDEKLLDETKRANALAEERIKAMQDMENAVNLQTEYQIWQDRGFELGKVNAASRLYQKK